MKKNVVLLQKNRNGMTYEERINESTERSVVEEAAIQLEASTAEKIDYLKANLHPTTVAYLAPLNFMLDQPFPYDEYDEHWFDEADEDNPAVPDDVISHDREVWLNAICLPSSCHRPVLVQ